MDGGTLKYLFFMMKTSNFIDRKRILLVFIEL
jgi:hypothetical protein